MDITKDTVASENKQHQLLSPGILLSLPGCLGVTKWVHLPKWGSYRELLLCLLDQLSILCGPQFWNGGRSTRPLILLGYRDLIPCRPGKRDISGYTARCVMLLLSRGTGWFNTSKSSVKRDTSYSLERQHGPRGTQLILWALNRKAVGWSITRADRPCCLLVRLYCGSC